MHVHQLYIIILLCQPTRDYLQLHRKDSLATNKIIKIPFHEGDIPQHAALCLEVMHFSYHIAYYFSVT